MADRQITIKERKAEPTGLDLLRKPFPPNCISKLPKPTAAQTTEVKNDFKKGIRCDICGGWHHPKVVHLDYVGHAALTDRLLDADPLWTWEPAVMEGLPNPGGGMWIRLTVCGVSRLGYGSADGKSGGDAIKEIIGDALRNAAMRFGAALDLWHKGDLHADEPEAPALPSGSVAPLDANGRTNRDMKATYNTLDKAMDNCATMDALNAWSEAWGEELAEMPEEYRNSLRGKFSRLREGFKAVAD
jgi:hypothetical protein